jgi:hypothetical protein
MILLEMRVSNQRLFTSYVENAILLKIGLVSDMNPVKIGVQ